MVAVKTPLLRDASLSPSTFSPGANRTTPSSPPSHHQQLDLKLAFHKQSELLFELDVYAQLPLHPSIIRPFAVAMLNVPDSRTYYWGMISDLWPKSLHDIMKMVDAHNKVAFDVDDVKTVFKCVAEAVKVCGDVGIVHCDINFQNVLVHFSMEGVDHDNNDDDFYDAEETEEEDGETTLLSPLMMMASTGGATRATKPTKPTKRRRLRIQRAGVIDFNLARPLYARFSPNMMAKRSHYPYYPSDQEITPAVDVYSLGFLTKKMLKHVRVSTHLQNEERKRLLRLADSCMHDDASMRPIVDQLLHGL